MFDYDRIGVDIAESFKSSYASSPRVRNGGAEFCRNVQPEESARRLSGGSSTNDVFDCGASSGYGSPGLMGTPLASPASNAQFIVNHLSKVFGDQGFCDETTNNSTSKPIPLNNSFGSSIGGHSPRSYEFLALSNSIKEFKQPTSFSSNAFTPPPSLLQPLVDLAEFPSVDEVPPEEHGKPSSMPPITNTNNGLLQALKNASKTTIPVAIDDGFSPDEVAQFAELLCSPKKAPPTRYQCHICYQTGHYISDCPMRFNSPYEELTPYQGRKKCYGEFQCHQCKRKWTSQNSVANEAQSCIKCHVSVFPHKQLPVDKAVALGLVKGQKSVQAKIAPIGHGRPPFNGSRN